MLSAAEIRRGRVLIVDDQKANVLLLERILENAGYVSVASTLDPRAVCDLHRRNRYDLILLDLRMPGMDGFQVMEGLKKIEPGGYPPVLVITAQPEHKLRALEAGGKDFISKPFDVAEVLARVHNLLEVRLLYGKLSTQNELLEERVRERTADLEASNLETIFAMTRAAEHKDENTGAHVKRISYYCRDLSTKLGMDEEFVHQIFFASPMHDVGKIGIEDRILLKPGVLTPKEWEVMKNHPLMGWKILGNSRSPYLSMGAEIALNHHERWDGSGYPDGKLGDAIPLSARIMNLCDVYDALRSKRPYKPAFDHRTAVDIIIRGDGRTFPGHFDPVLLRVFEEGHESFERVFVEHTESR